MGGGGVLTQKGLPGSKWGQNLPVSEPEERAEKHHCAPLLKGHLKLLARIPLHKTLFGAGPNKGLPIGNLNSQFFANVYLNGLDQFVKHQLKCRYYLRYCDDFVLLAPERVPSSSIRLANTRTSGKSRGTVRVIDIVSNPEQ